MSQPSPNRRRFRFSLRTLLVVTAVLCILLGWKMNQVQRQRRAVEAIQAQGGNVAYDYQYDENGWSLAGGVHVAYDYQYDVTGRSQEAKPPWPDWFSSLAGNDFFARVVLVHVQSGDFKDASPLAELPHLEWVSLIRTGVTDLTPLSDLKHLQSLILHETPVSDVSPLANLSSLEGLSLQSSQVTELSPLSNLRKLRYLTLIDTPVSDEEIAELQRALPKLKIIR